MKERIVTTISIIIILVLGSVILGGGCGPCNNDDDCEPGQFCCDEEVCCPDGAICADGECRQPCISDEDCVDDGDDCTIEKCQGSDGCVTTSLCTFPEVCMFIAAVGAVGCGCENGERLGECTICRNNKWVKDDGLCAGECNICKGSLTQSKCELDDSVCTSEGCLLGKCVSGDCDQEGFCKQTADENLVCNPNTKKCQPKSPCETDCPGQVCCDDKTDPDEDPYCGDECDCGKKEKCDDEPNVAIVCCEKNHECCGAGCIDPDNIDPETGLSRDTCCELIDDEGKFTKHVCTFGQKCCGSGCCSKNFYCENHYTILCCAENWIDDGSGTQCCADMNDDGKCD